MDICADQFGIRADQIMDPVFLCNRDLFDVLAASVDNGDLEPFLTSYILGPDITKKTVLERISKMLGLSLRNLPNPNNPHRFTEVTGLETLNEPSVEEWLYLCKKCQIFCRRLFSRIMLFFDF